MTTKRKFSETDHKLSMMITRRNLSKGTIKSYDIVFNEIFALFNKTPSDIVDIGKREQKPFHDKETGLYDIIELEDRTVTQYQFEYHKYLKERGLAPKTMKLKLDCFRALLGEYEIKKPKPIKLDIKTDRIRDKDIVSWEEIETAMSFCKGIRDKAILSFFVTTGLRSSDVRRLKISSLIQACDIYFEEGEEKNLETLLSKNPDDIIPCWEMMPKKTDPKSQLCVTFNTPEASNYLWQYLNDRIEKNIKKGENGIINPDEPLFATSKKNHLRENAVEKLFQRLNDNLGGRKDKNGVFGRVRTHSVRKLFSTTVRRNLTQIVVNSDKTSEIDIVSIFTGHVPPNESNSKVYEAIEDDSHDSYLRKVYTALVPYLSIQNVEVKDVKTQQYKNLEEQNEALKKQLEAQAVSMQREMDRQKEQYEKKIQQIESVNSALSTQVTDIQKQIDTINHLNDITRIQDYIADNDLVKKYSLASKIVDLYKEDMEKGIASVDNSYMDTLITRAYNHSIYEGENEFITHEEYIETDELYEKLRDEIFGDYNALLQGTNIQVSDLQNKKINEKLEDHLMKTWKSKGKVNHKYINDIIEDIILNG